jgi:hypothetical protein
MQNQIPKNFFGNLCRTKYRKTFSVIYAETINRKTFSVNILCVHCIIGYLSIKLFKFNILA